MKKQLLFFIAAMLLSVTSAFAQECDYSGTTGTLNWCLKNGTLTITGNGAMPNYTSGNAPWYSHRNLIQTVALGSGVTSIGNYAFQHCGNLSSIDISSVTKIGVAAFRECGSISTITIPSGVTSIENNAFFGCTSLNIVNFNATNCTTMGAIGYTVFNGCIAFTTLNIGNNVTRIPSNAFYGCNQITSVITMPSVINIGSYAFYDCSKITTVNLSSAVKNIANYAFYSCSALNSINLSNVTSIGESAFWGCSNFSSIDISNVTTIGAAAFRGCSSLTTITIPNGVTSIGNHAFHSCTSLEIVNFNATNCTTMGNSGFPVFQGCSALTTINVGSNVTRTPADAFRGCTNLQHIYSSPIVPPIAVNNSTFVGINKNTCILHVPTGTAGAYSVADGWKEFFNIVEDITPPFVPVTNITGVPTTATATVPLTLIGTIVPSGATNQTITWSVVSAGTTGANITGGNIFNTTNSGTAIVQATVVNGASPTTNYTQNCTITVSKAILGGVISITGNTVFGQTLTAVTTGLTSSPTIPNLGTLSYQWIRGTTNISGATSSTYNLVQADIGNVINVVVTAANCSGTVTSTNTSTVAKATQTAPAAPTMSNNTPTTITLNTVSGCEYSINGGAYQSSNIFGGLTPNTSYTFTQRKAETATHLPSPASPSAQFSTEAGTAPVLGGTVSITGNAIFGQTLTAITNLTSTPPTGDLGEIFYQWKRNDTPVGANAATYILVETDINHTITVTVTAANCTGSVTSNPTATVTKATQTAPAAPTLNNSTPTSITLNIVSDCEYSINGGAWQASPTFAGLMPNTSYAFAQRKTETPTHFASPSSVSANFTTDNTTATLYTIVSSVNNPTFGTITPYGENIVEEGNAIEFTIAPHIGYIIESVLINGTNHGAIYTYTFENVQEHGTIAVVFVENVGVNENALTEIRVYPNPTSGELIIENGEWRIENVEVFDIMGRMVATVETRLIASLQMDISHLPSGIYFMKIKTDAGEVVRKIVKQ